MRTKIIPRVITKSLIQRYFSESTLISHIYFSKSSSAFYNFLDFSTLYIKGAIFGAIDGVTSCSSGTGAHFCRPAGKTRWKYRLKRARSIPCVRGGPLKALSYLVTSALWYHFPMVFSNKHQKLEGIGHSSIWAFQPFRSVKYLPLFKKVFSCSNFGKGTRENAFPTSTGLYYFVKNGLYWFTSQLVWWKTSSIK